MSKLIKKALSKYKQGKYLDARNYYLKILKKDPYHLDANYLLGTLYAEQNYHIKSIAYLKTAAEIKPDSPSIQCNLGNVYYLQKQYKDAEPYFLRALDLDPNLMEAYVGLGGVWSSMGKDLHTVYECYQKALKIRPNTAATHQAMGVLLADVGNSDALVHLEQAMTLNPELKGIYKDYGCALLLAKKSDESASMFKRAIKQNPDDNISKYYLCVAEGQEPDADIRNAYAESIFDQFAEKFDHKLVDVLGYTVPAQARELLGSIYGQDLHFNCAVDLGCGTGLSGECFRDCIDNFIGIDISERMISKAKDRGCYDDLFHSDLTKFFDTTTLTFDFFLATDVVVYLGALNSFMEGICKKAAPGALIVFSTERSLTDDIVLQKSGRYAHSQNYIHSLAKKFDCSVVSEKHIAVRKESTQWIMGDLVVLSRA